MRLTITSSTGIVSRREVHGSEEKIAFQLFLGEIDEHLQRSLAGPDRERDRTIFWLYFRQGMSTREIGSLPGIGLSTKGVGSVIERMKQSVRDQILVSRADSAGDHAISEKQSSSGTRIDKRGVSEVGTAIGQAPR